MKIYYLQHGDENPDGFHPGEFKSMRIKTDGAHWRTARMDAFEDAHRTGYDTVGIMCSNVSLYRQPHGADCVRIASVYDHHGMWLYMNRLARRFSHVYTQTPWGGPVCAAVAVYRVNDVLGLPDPWSPNLGLRLSHAGHDHFSVSDYLCRVDGTSSKALKDAYETDMRKAFEAHVKQCLGIAE